MDIALAFFTILIIVVAFSEIKERNKKIKQLEKDWRFCKSLLDDARGILTEEQKEQLFQKRKRLN